ncbi:MAG: hypothetical protein RIC14_14400 [Filomicrobium sp.]
MQHLKQFLVLLPVVLALTFATLTPADAAVEKMYTAKELRADAKRLATAVRKIYSIGIVPTLTKTEIRGLGNVTFEFPMPQAGDPLLNFYAYRDNDGRSVVVMPILSLKALEDMTTAYAWVQEKGHRHSTIDLYYAMQRYRSPKAFPGGKYPPILRALGIPDNAYEQKGVDTLSLSLRNEAFAFILVHEFGHILFRHKGYRDITKAQARADEIQSDLFALDVLARSATPPLGAVLFFQAQVYLFDHRGNFKSDEDYDNYLMTVATHPMSVDRITAMADHIAGPLARKRGREAVIWVGIGEQLRRVAAILRDPDLQRCIAKVAAKVPISALKPGKSDQAHLMMSICGR